MTKPHAIFFDIDGTLISFSTHTIPVSAREAISRLREKGVKVIIATGRAFRDIGDLGGLEFDGYIAPNALVAGFFEPPAMDELLVLDGIAGGEELSGGSFRLRYTDARKAMDAIVGASAAGGWGLREMWVEKPSMDSVFAALSKGGNPPHNPGKK